MLILALDTALGACSAALFDGAAILAHRLDAMGRGQSEALFPMVNAVMAEAGAERGDISDIAVTRGPGGFTGLRTGLAAARGLALGLGRPCWGVTTFEAIAAGVRAAGGAETKPCLVAIDSRRGDVFVQAFSGAGMVLCEPAASPPECLEAVLDPVLPSLRAEAFLVAGDGAGATLDGLRQAGLDVSPAPVPGYPDARQVARLAGARRAREAPPDASPAPLYLRAPDATVPRHGGRLRP